MSGIECSRGIASTALADAPEARDREMPIEDHGVRQALAAHDSKLRDWALLVILLIARKSGIAWESGLAWQSGPLPDPHVAFVGGVHSPGFDRRLCPFSAGSAAAVRRSDVSVQAGCHRRRGRRLGDHTGRFAGAHL